MNPDLCVAVMVYIIAGLLMRIRSNPKTNYFILLGVAFAIGYFAKAILFPIAFVCLLVLLLAKVSLKKVALATAIFLAIAAPEVILIIARERAPYFFRKWSTDPCLEQLRYSGSQLARTTRWQWHAAALDAANLHTSCRI